MTFINKNIALFWSIDGINFSQWMFFEYPLGNWRTYSSPRAGTRYRTMPSGVEDGWYAGTDYFLEGDLQWIPPFTVVDAIDYTSVPNIGTLVPAAGFYDVPYSVQLVNPTVVGTQYYLGVLTMLARTIGAPIIDGTTIGYPSGTNGNIIFTADVVEDNLLTVPPTSYLCTLMEPQSGPYTVNGDGSVTVRIKLKSAIPFEGY